jgi:peptide/nickel transport system substrate-binding protein
LPRRLAMSALVVLVGALVVGCGGKSKSTATTSGAPSSGKTYPLLKVTWDAPDHMDPQLQYTVAAQQLLWNIYDGLVGFKHAPGAAGATIIPLLAESLPKISSNGLDYKFTLRPNLHYSNGKPVKASDFESTIERDFRADSPGVGFYSAIKGADQFAKTKKGGISGIITNDKARTIEIKLTQPRGDFLDILTLTFSSLVPAGTPSSDQSLHPIPSTGPYMIKAYSPSRSFTLVRNPYFKKNNIPDQPAGNPDVVQGRIITDGAAALETVLNGSSDYDFIPIPNDRLPTVQKKYPDRLKFYTSANTYYFFLNERVPPFDKIQNRKAVNYAIDRNALVQLFGGLGVTTQNILPPNYPGYKKIDVYTHDVAKAKQLVASSGDKGMKVTVWGDNTPPSSTVASYLADVLNTIGFKASPKVLSHQVYFDTIENQKTKAQTGWTDWYQDYPHPADWFDTLFNGERITATRNNVLSNNNVPSTNKQIDALRVQGINAKTNAGWAKVDKELIVDNVAAAPYLNRTSTDFFSARMDQACYLNHVLNYWDFSTSCVK